MVAAGVNLISIYGTTEVYFAKPRKIMDGNYCSSVCIQTGGLLRSLRDFDNDKAWNWLRLEGPIVQLSEMEDRGSNTFELIVKDGYVISIVCRLPKY